MTTPALNQRRTALGTANYIRSHNAQWKKTVSTGPRSVAVQFFADQLRGDVSGPVGALRTYQALTSLSGIGHSRAATAIAKVRIMSGDKRLRDLTERQRRELALYIEENWT